MGVGCLKALTRDMGCWGRAAIPDEAEGQAGVICAPFSRR